MKRLSIVLVLVPGLAFADLAKERFKSRRSIDTRGAAGLVRAPIPAGVHSGAREDLADLRVVDDRGGEVPYVIRTEPERREDVVVTPPLEDHVSDEEGIRFVLDLGEGRRPRHNRLRLQIDPRARDFRRSVLLEGSHDRATWGALRRAAWIYDFSAEPGRHADLREVDYPISTFRYLRVLVRNEGAEPLPITGCAVLLVEEHEEALHVAFRGRPRSEPRGPEQRTLLVVDLGRAGIPHHYAEIETSAVDFHRTVFFESRDRNEEPWQWVGSDVVHRIVVDGETDERLRLVFGETRGRFLRISIEDRDDPPLPISEVTVLGRRRDLLLRAEAGRTYALLHGFSDARRPSYELETVLARQGRLQASDATIGAWQRNPAYKPPPPPTPPLTDRFPILFYVVLFGAVGVLLALTVRLMRKAADPAPGPPG